MPESQFRNKITWFSFAFSLFVIWNHACNAELFLGNGETAAAAVRLEKFLGEGLGQIAVPGFFMISGYLFFRGFTWGKLREKWGHRVKSVLIPYLLWNFIYYMGYLLGSRLPLVGQVIGKGTIPWNLHELADALIYYKYNPVFWYLYQLLLLILSAPALYPILKKRWGRIAFFVVLGLMLLLEIQLPFLNADALMYYAAAAAFALAGQEFVEEGKLPQDGQAPSAEISLLFPVGLHLLQIGRQYSRKAAEISPPGGFPRLFFGVVMVVSAAAVYRIGLMLACPACFVACRLLAVSGLWLSVPKTALPKAGGAAQSSFFLYATHFAFVRLINKTLAKLYAPLTSPLIPMALYFSLPGILVCISGICKWILKQACPRLYAVLNGGRP